MTYSACNSINPITCIRYPELGRNGNRRAIKTDCAITEPNKGSDDRNDFPSNDAINPFRRPLIREDSKR